MTRPFTAGDKVYRYYTAEPSFIYGSGCVEEDGVVIGGVIRWNDKDWVPVIWQYSNAAPSLDLAGSVFRRGEL